MGKGKGGFRSEVEIGIAGGGFESSEAIGYDGIRMPRICRGL